MLSVTVNKELGVPVRFLQRASDPLVMRALSRSLAEETIERIKDGFARSVAPSGEPWAALKVRDGQPLRDTGRLMNSIHVSSMMVNGGFTVSTNVSYAPFHQFGTAGHGEHSRKQAVDKRGKFTQERGRGKRKPVGFRVLTFQAGRGAIPARPFMPINNIPAGWVPHLNAAAEVTLKRLSR